MRYPFLKGAVGEILRSAMGLDCAIQKGINNDRTTTQGADLQRTSERLDTVEKKAKGTSPTPSHPVPPLPVLLRQKLDQTRALGIEVDAPLQSSDRSNRWKYACPKCEVNVCGSCSDEETVIAFAELPSSWTDWTDSIPAPSP